MANKIIHDYDEQTPVAGDWVLFELADLSNYKKFDASIIVLNTTHRTSDGTDHSDVVLNNTHRTSNGTDHSYINQDVTSGASPTFANVSSTNSATANSHLVRLDQMNSAITGLSWQDPVLNQVNFVTSEPATPNSGDRYINTATGTSSVTAQSVTANYIYEWNGATWTEYVSAEGWTVWDKTADTNYTFNGSAWVEFGSTVSHNNTTGLQGGTTSEYYHLTATEHGYVSGVNAQSVLTTASPSFAGATINGDLTINSSTNALSVISSTDNRVYIEASSASKSNEIHFYNNSVSWFIGQPDADDYAGDGSDFYIGTVSDTPLFLIDSSGRVGIGTTDPGAKLDVNGSTYLAYGTGQALGLGTSSPKSIYKNHVYNHIDNDFNRTLLVEGARTTNLNTIASAMTFKLSAASNMSDGFGPGFLYAIEDDVGTENFIARTAAVRDGADNTGKFQIDVANAGVIGTVATFKASGSVGIGTSTPTDKLQVVGGDIVIDDGERFKSTNGAYIEMGTTALKIRAASGDDIEFRSGASGSVKAYILEDGQFGIGVSPNTATLHVSPIDSNHCVYIQSDENRGASRYALYVQDTDANGRGSVFVSTASGPGLTIQNGGTGYALNIDQNGTPTTYAVQIEKGAGVQNVRLLDNAQSTGTFWFYRSEDAAVTAGPVMFIEQDSETDDQPALAIQNDGTGNGLLIDMNGNGVGQQIDNAGTDKAIYIAQTGALANNRESILVYSNTAQTSGNALQTLYMDSASSTIPVQKIVNDGTGTASTWDQNGNGRVIYIDNAGQQEAIVINNSGVIASGQQGIHFYTDAAQTAGNALIEWTMDNASSTIAVQKIQNDGTGNGVFIDQNGNGVALNIDSEATSAASYGIKVYTGQGAYPALIGNNDNDHYQIRSLAGGTASHHFYRNYASVDTSAPVVFIEQDNSGDDQDALQIQQDGTGEGIRVNQYGEAIAADFNKLSTGGSTAVDIRNDGTGNGLTIDQNGNGIALHIDSEATTEKAILIESPKQLATPVFEITSGVERTGTDGNSMFKLANVSATSTGDVFYVENDGSGDAVKINQDGDGIALNIDSEATTADAVYIAGVNTDSDVVKIVSEGVLSSNASALLIYTANANTGSGQALVDIRQQNASATKPIMYIDQNGNATAIIIDTESTTTHGVEVAADALTTASALYVHADSALLSTSSNGLIYFQQANATADGHLARFRNEGTGYCLFLDNNGDSIALNIDSEATTNTSYALNVFTGQGAYAAYIGTHASDYYIKKTHTSGDGSNYFYRDIASADTAGPIMTVRNDNAGDDQPNIKIINDGAGIGLLIDQNGNNFAIDIDSEATTAPAIRWDVGASALTGQLGDADSPTGSYKFYRDLAAASTAGPVVGIAQENVGDDQDSLTIIQSGSGNYITAGPLTVSSIGTLAIAASTPLTLFKVERTDVPAYIEWMGGGGDSELRFSVNGDASYSVGIDDGDLDKFKISYGASDASAFGINDYFVIENDGDTFIDKTLTIGETSAYTGALTIYGGASGADMVTLDRGTASYNWALTGNYLTFTDGTGSYPDFSLKHAGGNVHKAVIGGDASASNLDDTRGDGELWAGSVGTAATDAPGASLSFKTGLGRGNDASSKLRFYTALPEGTSTTLQSHTEVMQMTDGVIYQYANLYTQEKSSDPDDPAEGYHVIWQSDGTGTGDDGDIMIKITAGGSTKTTTLVDFSAV